MSGVEDIVGSESGGVLDRRTVLKLPLLVAGGAAFGPLARAAADPAPSPPAASRWSPERADQWNRAQGWLVGANYVTSTAINQLEMFQPDTFHPLRIHVELGWARSAGFNAVRVFLHDQLWTQDARGFQARLAQFVAIAADHGIKPLFVLFDSCWDPFPKAGPQRAPTPGVHNSGWVQSPGAERIDDRNYLGTLRDYVTGVLTQFRNDDRVLGWDLWNEPDNPSRHYASVERPDKEQLVADLLPQVFGWARAVDPAQPLTSAVWQGEWPDAGSTSAISAIQLENSDVLSFHSYGEPAGFENRIDELSSQDRPILCTEYLARPLGSTVADILPIAKRRKVAALNWGLVAGKTQTYFPWDSWDRPYPSVPDVWFHDLLQPDGRPFQEGEIQTIRELTGGAMHLNP